MKGPSLEAIRKFKEEQERKKLEQDDRKIKEKLSTLEHRAAQGDRKAKSTLIKIEKIEKEKTLGNNVVAKTQNTKSSGFGSQHIKFKQDKADSASKRRPKPAEFDFDDLMKMAKQNNNHMGKPPPPPPKDEPQPNVVIKKKVRPEPAAATITQKHTISSSQATIAAPRNPIKVSNSSSYISRTPIATNRSITRSENTSNIGRPDRPSIRAPAAVQAMNQVRKPIGLVPEPSQRRSAEDIKRERNIAIRKAVARHMEAARNKNRYYDDEDEDEYDEDEYDDDLGDFVVDEDEDDVADEVSKTIKSVFNYDKRRCDRREEELDRQYRAIGRVNTFEDLEREERRASRLAAAEDARAQREEDERKRLKALRLKKHK